MLVIRPRWMNAPSMRFGTVALAASALAHVAAAQTIPTRAFAPVQDGPVSAVRQTELYEPGRVLIHVTTDAHRSSALEKKWRTPGQPFTPVLATGLPGMDAELAAVGVTDVRRALIDANRVELAQDLGLDRWYLADIAPGTDVELLATRLRALPEVEEAKPDWRAFPASVPNDPLHNQHWGHDNNGQMLDFCWNCGGHPAGSPVGTVGFDGNAETAWDAPSGYGSSSVVIAIIDSGVEAGHPDLRQVAGFDYGSNDSNPDDNSANAGHGTACAGVAAAIQNNGLGTAGIAGGASIMPLKVANSAGSMSFSSVANAIIHAADNGADIASLSLGASISNDANTSSAITYANNSGVTLLAATANSNSSTIDYPANHALVIGVGAAAPCGGRKRSSSSNSDVNPGTSTDPNGVTCDNERWWGSSYGTNSPDAAGAVDLIAPTILPTTDLLGSAGYDSSDYSLWFNGTSCATPYAAGVCALIKTANPGFSPAQVRNQLLSTCADVQNVESGLGWDRYSGYGMVDAAAAVGGGSPPAPQDYATLPYSTGFESANLDSFWRAIAGVEGRIQITTANGPFSGSRHLTMDDSVSGGSFSQNEAWLHLDLAGQSQVDLQFQWKEFGDETHAQDGVYFSSNGGSSFTKVANLSGGSTPNNTWQNIALDLDDLAVGAGLALTSTFVVKIQQYDNYPIASDGFAIDSVSVQAGSTGGGPTDYAQLPYSTGFEGGLDSFWATTEGVEGRIQVSSANGPFAGGSHLTMDDEVNGGAFSQNEAWLRLDLSGEDEVDLAFRWKEFGDETHAQDGIYMSDNGGASFSKVHDLNGGSFTNNTWQLIELDLDDLAASAGRSLTSTFVVKFQQYDNYGIGSDGFAFDSISVEAGSGGPSGYASLPYSTGFESGSLDANWATVLGTEGRIEVTTANGPFAGSRHLTLDDSVNGGAFSQNEAWMRLDLSGESQVNLAFRWKEFGDETHSQDGIYLSDNAGLSFTKVHNLNGGSTANNSWQLVNLDLDALASSAGLSLTSTFVVKFQQFDNYAIGTDGFAFDAITVD